MGEVIFLGEKSKYRLTGWPGDEYHERTNNTIPISNETRHSLEYLNKALKKKNAYKKTSFNTPYQNKIEDKRPSSMKARYFSIENIQKVNEAENLQPKEAINTSNEKNATEPEEFKIRRDYLIKKLLQSRTLPELTNITETSTPNESVTVNETITKNELKDNLNETASTENLQLKPSRKHLFQDEFIPLFDFSKNKPENADENESEDDSVQLDEENDSNRKIYNPKLNTIENYKGPYSIKCLMRARQYLIDCFKPYSNTYSRSNFEDRLFEILKMKLNIKSKFDDDAKLWRKIKRETTIEKEAVYERIESQNKRVKNYFLQLKPKNKHDRFIDDEDTDSDVIFEKISKKSKSNKKAKKSKTYLVDLDESENNDEEDDVKSEDILKLISHQETFENLDYDEDDDDTNFKFDEDSKCIQFGNYSKNKEIIKKPKKKKVKSSSLRPEKSKNKSDDESDYRIDRTGLKDDSEENDPINNELNEWELKYRKLRNERNKLLRKKKGIEINALREKMSNELRNIRRIMKKMRRKHHSKSQFQTKPVITKSKSKKNNKK